ncbi:hypothetical protein BDZ97DRAFT_1659924 [Flammula alnicola]|nr:hypothetical protein BDZ97DRAFT_1659924 [Flammula alnicola]
MPAEAAPHVDLGLGDQPDAASSTEGKNGKKQRQWRKWSEDIIPSLLEPYLQLLRESEGLRNLELLRNQVGCAGCARGQFLDVSCIFFNKIEKIKLCTCTEPALQLLRMGLFPCAPSQPSLAVDLNVLDFTSDLFVNAAPNTTAWCETLEGFLSAQHFKLETRVSISFFALRL